MLSAVPGPRHRERTARRRPWLPAGLAAHGLTVHDVGALRYIVVEEIVEDIADLTISPWPAADGHGRLRFELADVDDIAIPLRQLLAELYRGWMPGMPRIGDVFAGRVDREAITAADGVWAGPLERAFPGPIYNLTAEGRLVAKLAWYAVRSDLLPSRQAAALGMEATMAPERARVPIRARLGPGTATPS